MILCECDENGVCTKCGQPRRNCNTKRHCPSAGTPLTVVLKKRFPVGSAIAAVLAYLKIKMTATCTCSTTRQVLDYNGAAWTLRHAWQVAGKIAENAKRLNRWCPKWAALCVVLAGIVLSLAMGAREVGILRAP